MDIIDFLSAFGLGAIVTALIQAWLSQRADIAKRNFQEKKEVYIGILDAFRAVLVHHSNETAKNVGYWKMRCNLVGSKEVCAILEEIIEADKTTQPEKLRNLQAAMRNDLGVQPR
jgi:invasion protein IalB